jgi:hypothetical protein
MFLFNQLRNLLYFFAIPTQLLLLNLGAFFDKIMNLLSIEFIYFIILKFFQVQCSIAGANDTKSESVSA